tara:strand:+ start:603 stop:1067 length:465 start_codon:yes stop_codon:yes gene_type:complete
MKLNFDAWLLKTIDYETTYYIKDVLNELFDYIINFVNRNDEIEFDYGIETMKFKFYTFIYTYYYLHNTKEFKPYDEDMYEYFDLKFSSDILDIFSEFKEITKQYNLDLFFTKYDLSIYLQEFLFDMLLIKDPYNDDELTDEENNIDIYIDETDL